MTVTLAPELLKDLRAKTNEAIARNLIPGDEGVHVVEVDPSNMLAMLDRIEALEAKWERPSHWRCDGCGHTVTPRNGREPDAHPSCGGVWIRLG